MKLFVIITIIMIFLSSCDDLGTNNNVSQANKNISELNLKNNPMKENIDYFHVWTGWIEVSVLTLTAAILAMTLFVGIYTTLTIKNSSKQVEMAERRISDFQRSYDEQRNRIENKIENIDIEIKNRVNDYISSKIDSKIKNTIDKTEKFIVQSLDRDFSGPLEKRYLLAEYLLNSIWNSISNKIAECISSNRIIEIPLLLNKLSSGQLAVRQLLSNDEKDIFTGLGTLRVMANNNLLSSEYFWKLIVLLNKQNRFSQNNYYLSKQIGSDFDLRL
ncbi:MAG: hypothetical protein AB7S50_15695 [Bacteroidales bacterium]